MTSTSKPSSATERSVPHTRIEDESMIEETYELGRKLGQGSFGIVREAKNRASNRKWAIKAISKDFKDKDRSSALKLLEREVAILKRVHHEHIIHLEEVFESSKKIYLVMELCEGGELADVLKLKKTFSEHDAKVVLQKLTSAIKYLHKNVHRDLKLENILLTENPDDPEDKLHIKVTDFGLSVVKDGIGHDSMMQAFCGTPIYMSPEIIDNKTYSQQCDIWAMGVIMYMLLCGGPPFKARDEEQLYIIIKRGHLDFSGSVWQNISEEAKNLLHGMLKVDPAHRLTASEILAHPWFTGDKLETGGPSNVLEMMKQWKDELRLGQTDHVDDDFVDSAINGEQGDEDVDKKKTNGSSTNSSKMSLSSSGSDRCRNISNESNNVTASPSKTSNNNRPGYSPGTRGRRSQTSAGSSSPSSSSKNNSPSSSGLSFNNQSNQRNSTSTGRSTPPKHAAKTSATAITKPATTGVAASQSMKTKNRKK
ncbi:serine/threonine-protein kinase 33-like isoform X2 [Tubulanus polymorphus]|uniref:serine/threonine-protein kinase 33-like isoform X2 n=1 Tax=Tubulanus polymorphus TaxID=672921 RepID=UPI003DA42900